MKTDNSYIEEKIDLRISAISEKKSVTVLDCYAGTGKLWTLVKQRTGCNISVVGIEKENGKNKYALPGDNIKYLKNIDLSKFDIIDLDAYGIPFAQL